jgi:hypothetical protein
MMNPTFSSRSNENQPTARQDLVWLFNPITGYLFIEQRDPEYPLFLISPTRLASNVNGYQNAIATFSRSLTCNPVTGYLFIEQRDPKYPPFLF